jgi:hypothetical protein
LQRSNSEELAMLGRPSNDEALNLWSHSLHHEAREARRPFDACEETCESITRRRRFNALLMLDWSALKKPSG